MVYPNILPVGCKKCRRAALVAGNQGCLLLVLYATQVLHYDLCIHLDDCHLEALLAGRYNPPVQACKSVAAKWPQQQASSAALR